ncbi:hypothetical protein AB7A76_24125 [Klebsiella pneumoniae]
MKLDELKRRPRGRAGAGRLRRALLGDDVAWAFGYTDAVGMATIGGGAVTCWSAGTGAAPGAVPMLSRSVSLPG